MMTIHPEDLAGATGGKTETIGKDGTYTYSQTPYETCVGLIEKGAREKDPDTRNVWDRLWGNADKNAGPRADWTRDSIPAACGTPK